MGEEEVGRECREPGSEKGPKTKHKISNSL